jgi:hypothetical protein
MSFSTQCTFAEFTLSCAGSLLLCCNIPSLFRDFSPTEKGTYKIIFRVVRPRWRTESARRDQPAPSAVVGSPFPLSNPNSDAEVLRVLNRQYSAFQFQRIVKKSVVEVQADTILTLPTGFSQHNIQVVVIEQKPEKINEVWRLNGPMVSFNPKQESNAHQILSAVPNYRSMFPPEKIRELRQQNKILIGVSYDLYANSNGKKKKFLSASGPRIVERNMSFCLTYDLYVQRKEAYLSAKSDKATLIPTDVIIATILEK